MEPTEPEVEVTAEHVTRAADRIYLQQAMAILQQRHPVQRRWLRETDTDIAMRVLQREIDNT
jgi:hypothetical protein